MPYYRILTNRFAEWNEGDYAAMDDEAARVPLEMGEIEPVGTKNHTNSIQNPELEPDGYVCSECGKVCKSKAGLSAHLRTHK